MSCICMSTTNEAVRQGLETPEGHTVEYGEHGAVVRVELMGVRSAVDDGGELQLTWPPAQVAASALREVLTA